MVFFNHATRQMTAKIVYYGPGLCGKTTNLNLIYERTTRKSRGEMVSLNTETDRTLFFDLLPMEVGTISGFKAKLQLYTVPGQVFYNSTRKLVLKGVDGIVFVADSQMAMLDANRESLDNLAVNLRELGVTLADVPLVFQWNKRDLKHIIPVDDLERDLNPRGLTSFQAIAREGVGVFETLRGISKMALAHIKDQCLAEPAPAFPAPAPAPRRPASDPPAAKPLQAGDLALPLLESLNTPELPLPPLDPGTPTVPAPPPANGRAVPGPGAPGSLPEGLGFLAPPLAPEPPRPLPAGEAAGRAAEPGMKVMAPLVVKLPAPHPVRPAGAPRLAVRPPALPRLGAVPKPPAPHGAPSIPRLEVALPAGLEDGSLDLRVVVLRDGAVVAEAETPVAGPGHVVVELKRS